jgi:predicted nucleotidyltransferase
MPARSVRLVIVSDPLEALDEDGMIRTGASIHRIPKLFRPILDATVSAIRISAPDASVYVYGSVATGQASSPRSDVDLLTVGLDAIEASRIAATQSATARNACRSVEIAAVAASDFAGDSDAAYGRRVFLHHYCVRLAGADLDRATSAFAGDRRAARGFNGDIERHVSRWKAAVETEAPGELGVRIARKTLLAVAGLVSLHDTIWTTDRRNAARRWSEVHPGLEAGLDQLLAWAYGTVRADGDAVHRELGGVVSTIAQQFADNIGLWPADAT